MIVQIRGTEVNVSRSDCGRRECFSLGHDRGPYVQGRGYTGSGTGKALCLTRHLHGCPTNSICLKCNTGSPLHVSEAGGACERRDCDGLRKWCDARLILDWRTALKQLALDLKASHEFDLIVGNPAFSHILRSGKVWSSTANKGKGGWINTKYRPRDDTMVPTLLLHATAVLLLHHGAAFEDSENGREVWRAYTPACQWKLGRLGFRGDGKTDNRPYCASLWLRKYTGRSCSAYMLDEPESRQWAGTPPGSESIEDAKLLGLPLRCVDG